MVPSWPTASFSCCAQGFGGRWARMKSAEVNPTAGIKRPRKETTRDRTLTEKEIRLLWNSLELQPTHRCRGRASVAIAGYARRRNSLDAVERRGPRPDAATSTDLDYSGLVSQGRPFSRSPLGSSRGCDSQEATRATGDCAACLRRLVGSERGAGLVGERSPECNGRWSRAFQPP